MGPIRQLRVWLHYLAKGALGSRRFVGLTPPSFRHQVLYDRREREFLHVHVRDADDWIQLEHIFLNEEYDLSGTGRTLQIGNLLMRMQAEGVKPLVVDLGANIGLASKYFEHTYRGIQLIAVEPEESNCEVATQNISKAATLLRAAISSEPGCAKLVDMGRNNAFRVDRCDGGAVRLTTVREILDTARDAKPFLIKIDIEGFERDLFANNTEWIDQFPILLIELHDWMLPGACVTRNFLREMASRDREFMHFNGYVVSLALT